MRMFKRISKIASVLLIFIVMFSCTKEEKTVAKDEVDFILDWKALADYSGYFVAKEKGFYDDENIEINILEGTGAPDSAKLIGVGKYNIGVCSGAATVIGKSQGMPIVSLAVLFQKAPTVIFSLKERGITKPEDMVGKTLGVHYHSIEYKEYLAMLNKLGIDRSKIKEVGVGWELQPLLTGQIDMLMGYTENQPVQVEVLGKEVNRIPVADYGVNLYSTNIIANEEFLKKEPDLVKRIMRATMKGWQYTVDHPDEAAKIFLKTHPAQDPKFVKAMLAKTIPLMVNENTKKKGLGYQALEGWSKTQDLLNELGLIEKKVDPKTLFSNDYM